MSANEEHQKVPLGILTGMVVGGMVGAGVFSIPRNFAQATGVYGALIAWAIAGAGMLMLAFVFQALANRKPDLDAGVYAYARAGFVRSDDQTEEFDHARIQRRITAGALPLGTSSARANRIHGARRPRKMMD